MSVVGDAMGAIKEALKLVDDVKRVAEAVKDLSRELRDQDRRLTRLEAKWETAVELSALRSAPRRVEGKS